MVALTTAAALLALAPAPAHAAEPTFVVAGNGSDANPGTVERPLKSIQKAIDLATPGATILIRGGTYAVTTNVQIRKSGELQGASANNLILNLDSYGNRDPRKNGESADGLAVKEGSGTGNVVRGARLWNNVDDGFGAWLFASPIRIENSVAYGNGYNRWNLPDFSGDGNGFKLGGGNPAPAVAHALTNNMSFKNAAGGFVGNGNPGATSLTRNTAWRNAKNGFTVDRSQSKLTGNLAVGNAKPVSLGSSTGSGNSWDVKSSWSDSDLASTSTSTIAGSRDSAGNIRPSTFLQPKNHAQLGARI
jgi:hypothetical protein